MNTVRDADLQFIISEACETMLRALPTPEECERVFSSRFEEKMKKMIRREKLKAQSRRLIRSAAAVLLVIVLGFGSFLAANAEARASFFGWIREVYQSSIVYRYLGDDTSASKIPEYELGLLPEGFLCTVSQKDDLSGFKVYECNDDVIFFSYYLAHENIYSQYIIDPSIYDYSPVTVNGLAADFYLSTDPSETNELIFNDKRTGVVFELSSFLDEVTMLQIAENIAPVE